MRSANLRRSWISLLLVGLMLLPMGVFAEDMEAISLKMHTLARVVEPGSTVSVLYTLHNGLADGISSVRFYATEDGGELETVQTIVPDGYHVGALEVELEKNARTIGVEARFVDAQGEEHVLTTDALTLYTAYLEGMDPSGYWEAEPIVLTDGEGTDLLSVRRMAMPASMAPWPGQEMLILYTLENLADVDLADIIIGDDVFIPVYGEREPFTLAPGETCALIAMGTMGTGPVESHLGISCVPQNGKDVTIMGSSSGANSQISRHKGISQEILSILPITFESGDMLLRMDLDGPKVARDGEKVVLTYALENKSGYRLTELLFQYGPVGEISEPFSMAPGERITGNIATTLRSDDALRHLAVYGFADTGTDIEEFFSYSNVLDVELGDAVEQAAPRRAGRKEAAAATGLSLLLALPAVLEAISFEIP